MKSRLPIWSALIAASLASSPLLAQAVSSLSEPPPAKDGQLSQNSQDGAEPTLPPNVSVSTPDGKPLPPELMQKVVRLLARDPAVRAAANAPSTTIVAKSLDGTDIVVTARPLRGRVIGNVAPIRSLNPLDIRAYGASTIGDLIQNLGGEAVSAQGTGDKPPILLLNGRRISTIDEISLYPTEAIERLEIFPEALALQYGYPPDQKVVNIVTFEFFTYKSARLTLEQPTSGGRDKEGIDFQILRIIDKTRYNFDASYKRSGQLLESQRVIVEPPDAANDGKYRTLQPKSHDFSVSGSLSGMLTDDTSYTAKASGSFDRMEALLGPGAGGPIREDLDSRSLSVAGVLSGQIHNWLWSSTSTLSLHEVNTSIDVNEGSAPRADASETEHNLSSDLSATGNIFKMPAGGVLATVRAEYDWQHIDRRQSGYDADQLQPLARQGFAMFASLTVPLLNAALAHSSGQGDLSLDGHVGLQRWTDQDAIFTFGSGVYWSPARSVHLHVAAEVRKDVPTLEQLGAPLVVTPDVRLYDFAEAKTVEVMQTSGGNSGLLDAEEHSVSAGLSIKDFLQKGLLLSVDYISTRTRHPIEAPAIVTDQIVSAFPDRFTFDTSGQLEAVDARPLNISRTEESKLRWGVNLTKAIGHSSIGDDLVFSPVSDGPLPPGTLPANTRIIDNPPGTPLPPDIENAISRIYFSFYHVWRLSSTAELRPGAPKLNLLNGFGLSGDGGTPRHEVTFSGGVFKHGIGARANLRWNSPTRIYGRIATTATARDRLDFSYPLTMDLQFFVNPEDRIVGTVPGWVKGVQIVLSITNLTNARPKVRDANGKTPIIFQQGYLDPIGRSIKLSLRKVL